MSWAEGLVLGCLCWSLWYCRPVPECSSCLSLALSVAAGGLPAVSSAPRGAVSSAGGSRGTQSTWPCIPLRLSRVCSACLCSASWSEVSVMSPAPPCLPMHPSCRVQFSRLVAYLQQKERAGVVKIPPAGQVWPRMLYIVPPPPSPAHMRSDSNPSARAETTAASAAAGGAAAGPCGSEGLIAQLGLPGGGLPAASLLAVVLPAAPL